MGPGEVSAMSSATTTVKRGDSRISAPVDTTMSRTRLMAIW